MNVLVSCPALYDLVDLARIEEIQPGARRSRSHHTSRPRERAPHDHYADELTSERRDAFAAADVIVTLHAQRERTWRSENPAAFRVGRRLRNLVDNSRR